MIALTLAESTLITVQTANPNNLPEVTLNTHFNGFTF